MVFLRKSSLPSVSLLLSLFLFSCSFPETISQVISVNRADTTVISVESEKLSGSYTDNDPGNNINDADQFVDSTSAGNIEDPVGSNASTYNSRYTINSGDKLIYVLQNTGFKELYRETFNIAVIDPDDSGLNAEELGALKDQGKLMIAYLSIGEAEDYRSYWESGWDEGNPDFISEENPYWSGNYKVKYWDSRWKNIIFEKLEKIINTGYQGVYLDLVDAYEYFEDMGYENASSEMIDFVIRISDIAKITAPGFLIIPQNGEELTADPAYLSAIDGVGKENLWFLEEKKIDHSINSSSLDYLVRIKESGRSVFVIEYLDIAVDILLLAQLSEKYGFIYYAGGINLDCISN